MLSYKNTFYKPDSIFKKILKLDWFLLFVVSIICTIGVGALYSAGDGSLKPWALNHFYKIILGFFVVSVGGLGTPPINPTVVIANGAPVYASSQVYCV